MSFSKDAVSNSQMMKNINLNSNNTCCSSGRRGDIIPSSYKANDAELTTRIRQSYANSGSSNHNMYSDVSRVNGKPF